MTNLNTLPHHAVRLINGQPMTTSLAIAEVFEKKHKNVLQSLKSLHCSKSFRELNFQPTQIEVNAGLGQTRLSPAYNITKDGFVFLVMGFSGAKAAAFKEAYIAEFNRLSQSAVDPMKEAIASDLHSLEELSLAMNMFEVRVKNFTTSLFERAKAWALEEVRRESGSLQLKAESAKKWFSTSDIAKELGTTHCKLYKVLEESGIVVMKNGIRDIAPFVDYGKQVKKSGNKLGAYILWKPEAKEIIKRHWKVALLAS